MATEFEFRLPSGQKAAPDIINADDSVEGYALRVEDDGAGGLRTALLPMDTDPGVPLGTPSNLVLTLSAGSPIIVNAWPSEPTRIHEFNVSPISLNLGNVGALKLECPIIVAGPAGARIALRGLLFIGGAWGYLDLTDGPFVAADAVNESDDVILAALGDWGAIDETFAIDNLQIEMIAYGGDDETPGVFGNVYVFAVSADADVPPTSETPEPPEIPTTFPTLLADWDPTEQSGSTLADKS